MGKQILEFDDIVFKCFTSTDNTFIFNYNSGSNVFHKV